MLSVNTNVAALNAYRNLSLSNDKQNQSMQRLSSGYRINSAADDAAGLAISTGMGSQISGMTQAVRNTQDGISVIQTASGALTEATSILQRMRDLAVQSSNASNSDSDRKDIDAESQQLKQELGRIAQATTFNGQQLLGTGAASGSTVPTSNGSGALGMTFQVGANNTSADQITVSLGAANLDAILGSGSGSATTGTPAGANIGTTSASGTVDLTTASGAKSAIDSIDKAIGLVSAAQANLGAMQNRFTHTVNNLNTAIQNTTEAQSRIRDTDMASEMTNFSKSQILVQAGTAMLSQANSSSQSILKLLQG